MTQLFDKISKKINFDKEVSDNEPSDCNRVLYKLLLHAYVWLLTPQIAIFWIVIPVHSKWVKLALYSCRKVMGDHFRDDLPVKGGEYQNLVVHILKAQPPQKWGNNLGPQPIRYLYFNWYFTLVSMLYICVKLYWYTF